MASTTTASRENSRSVFRSSLFFLRICNVLLGALINAPLAYLRISSDIYTFRWCFHYDEAESETTSTTCFAYNHSFRSRKQNRKFQFLYSVLAEGREKNVKRVISCVSVEYSWKIWKLKFLTLFHACWLVGSSSNETTTTRWLHTFKIRVAVKKWKDEMLLTCGALLYLNSGTNF